MNRENYLNYRLNENYSEILYAFVVENGFKMSRSDFEPYFIAWVQKIGKRLIDYYLGRVLDKYDLQFNLQFCESVTLVETTDINGTPIKTEIRKILRIT